MIRAYYVYGVGDPDEGVAIVATTAQQARILGERHIYLGFDSFLDIRAKWIRHHAGTGQPIDVSDLPIGHVFEVDGGVERGVYLGEDDAP